MCGLMILFATIILAGFVYGACCLGRYSLRIKYQLVHDPDEDTWNVSYTEGEGYTLDKTFKTRANALKYIFEQKVKAEMDKAKLRYAEYY